MEKINKSVLNLITSITVREYIKSIGYAFSIKEQISLIFNSDKTLQEKKDIILEYMNYKSNLTKEDIKEINIVINALNTILEMCNGKEYIALCCNSLENGDITAISLKSLIIYLYMNDATLENNCITVVDVENKEDIANLYVNKELEVIDYEFKDKNMHSFYENSYVKIPNNFKLGEIVTLCNNTKQKYIVALSDVIPKHFEDCCSYEDNYIQCIPIEVFNNSKDYKNQIDKFFKDRIQQLEIEEEQLNNEDSAIIKYLPIQLIER